MVKDFVRAILKTQHRYRQAMLKRIREHNIDLTFEMLHLLRNLVEAGKMNQQMLVEKTFTDKSSLSYLLKNMEKRNLIRRVKDTTDKRNNWVLPTEEGHLQYTQAIGCIDELYKELEARNNEEHIRLCMDYLHEFGDSISSDLI